MASISLVADDDPLILRMLTDLLEQRGFGVDIAHDGEEAYERALARPPDVLITDVMMPRLDGWSLVRKLRLEPKLARLRVIFLTAVSTDDARVQAFRLGADDYVNKPFKMNDLVSRIERVPGAHQPVRHISTLISRNPTLRSQLPARHGHASQADSATRRPPSCQDHDPTDGGTMTIARTLTFAISLLAIHVTTASSDSVLRPPSSVATEVEPRGARPDPLATTERWGGGIRLTGLSGIGALPGRNFGGEVAGQLRRDELFVELALARWKPEETYVVTDSPERPELGLDVWTLRGGFASMKMPLRGWLLVELGEIAGARGMPGVVTRMVMGDTPQQRQWRAAGAGLGVAWPMSDQARLFGSFEVAIPLDRERIMLDRRGMYEPDPLAARCSLGLEVGWR